MAAARRARSTPTAPGLPAHLLPAKSTASNEKGNGMKDKLPAVLWYASDWLGSNTRARMTHQQRDVYLTLLFRSWYELPAGTLPNNDKELAMMGGVDIETWERIKAPIVAKFESNGNGRVFNPRMAAEARKMRGRTASGASGWSKERRAKQSKAMKRMSSKPNSKS